MASGVNLLCFTASYAIALALEAAGLWTESRWRRPALLLAAGAGLVAHTLYLGQRVVAAPQAPLSSRHDWFLLAAWVLAAVFWAVAFYRGKSALGLFLLPLALGMISASQFAATAPLAGANSARFWGQLHGMSLMLGTLAVLLGFVTGLMYLAQSRRLKHKLTTTNQRLRLPSLEWLERANSRSLAVAAACVGVGFLTGVILRLAEPGDAQIPWNDPVVVSLAAMLAWLVIAEGFRLVYPAARRGRKVAYLTLAAFVFLVLTLLSFVLHDSFHQTHEHVSEAAFAARSTFPRGRS